MAVTFDFEKMKRLLSGFYKISGVRYSLADENNNLLVTSSDFSGFCGRINALPEGHTRCVDCDARALAHVSRCPSNTYTYRCHAGLTETVICVRAHGETVAYIFFGQMIDSSDVDARWEQTRRLLSWYPDADSLKDAFWHLRRVDRQLIDGCADIMLACSSYIWMEGVVNSGQMSDIQQLNAYLSEHYMEELSLDTIAKALSRSKTRLCQIASQNGTTVNTMLLGKRMAVGKSLLQNTRHSISEVSYLIGIRDYNYFTKLFKKAFGVTPTDYRKLSLEAAEQP